MSNSSVLCLGEILFDCLANERGKKLEEVASWTPYPGGAPANVACALVKLGTSAGFIGWVGEDEPGKELRQLCQEVGVDISGVQDHPNAPTRQIFVLRTETGDREFAGFGDKQADEFADAFLDLKKLPTNLFATAEFLVIGTLELAYPQTRSAIFRALELAEQYSLKVVLDVNWRPMFWDDTEEALSWIKKLWPYIDFLKLSDEEAEWLFNTTDAGAIKYRLDTVEGVLVTAGDGDISYCLGENEGKLTSFSVEVEETTGAGDSFVAGLIHQLATRGIASLKDAQVAKEIVTYACAVGALTTTKSGAIASQPTAAEV
ncbi:MAG: carbohydrate kinase, partial [Spirulinaceae cyanobacterium]